MENNCKGSICEDQGCPAHYANEIDLSTPEGQAAYEAEARLYAEITSEANEIAPLLNQTFKVQFKGSNEAFNGLKDELFMSHSVSNLVGKEFDAEIDWDFKLRPVLRVLKVFGDYPGYFYPYHLRKIGLLPKMIKTHREIYGHLYPIK